MFYENIFLGISNSKIFYQVDFLSKIIAKKQLFSKPWTPGQFLWIMEGLGNKKVIDGKYAISKVWHTFLLLILQKTTVILINGE